MSEAGFAGRVSELPLADREARDRINLDLQTNLLVEAGAGSGKTTALTHRMVALIRAGATSVEQIAAVTFTRKAAAELRERFQGALERALADCPSTGDEHARLNEALRTIDRAFIGTIHAFCARLLRERPLEAGIDPTFEETSEAEMYRLRKRYWHAFLERLVATDDPMLAELAEVGLRPDALESAFETVSDNLDVPFPARERAAPDAESIESVRRELLALMERGLQLMPETEPAKGWDDLQKRLRALAYRRDVQDWEDRRSLFGALSLLFRSRAYRVTQNRWSDTAAGRSKAKRLQDDVNAFIAEDGPARRLHERWLAHRYEISIRLVTRAAAELAEHRRRHGSLDFQDLLILAAELLRESPSARRELGLRYRRILVDEFQDTDPVQAEVLLLLASEPTGSAEQHNWRTAVPRDGALFVVGDPKQSIYRFRRADIVVYDFVKRRFAEFGEVLDLVTNFRSRQGIADLVNGTFGEDTGLFPKLATPQQAAFSPLLIVEGHEPAPREGVFRYRLDGSGKQRVRAGREAGMLAEWIASRVGTEGDRKPGDFLILTRYRKNLDLYARALEARNVPVDVSGARVGVEAEITELMSLLRALSDPEDPVGIVSVLTGLFFGLDLEMLAEHKLQGGRFRYTDSRKARTGGAREVNDALERLRAWWLRGIRLPADVLLGGLVAELGLYPYASTGELGTVRAGALGYALDAVRARALSGDASLTGAIEAIDSALDWEDAETPFEPGRTDLARVMNIHRAKGLEAPVVILTGAETEGSHPVRLQVERPPTGPPSAYLAVTMMEGWATVPLARPLDWDTRAEGERTFDAAERNRLQYVAATRAKDELVIGGIPGKEGSSPWRGLHPALARLASDLDLLPGAPPTREEPAETPDDLGKSLADARASRLALATPTYRMDSVTALAKEAPAAEAAAQGRRATGRSAPDRSPGHPSLAATAARGYEWGSAVHAALAAAARGVEGEAFRLLCRALLAEFELPVDDEGEPRHLPDLLDLVRRVRESELWRRALTADERHVEVPFAASLPPKDAVPLTVEGVVDLAFREADGWVIADYKTDRGDDPEFERRVEAYRRQVEIYARCWGELTGEPVKERILLFTATGEAERW